MSSVSVPRVCEILRSDARITEGDVMQTSDGFFLIYKSLASLLTEAGIVDFPDSSGERLPCDRFFDDWFLYAVPKERGSVFSLLKFREQEHDAEDGSPADGDTPGVTVSFVAFDYKVLLDCLAEPTDENRRKLNREINRVVACKGQRHHDALKKYFKNPRSEGAYQIASAYTAHIASFAENGFLETPDCYKAQVQQSVSYKTSAKANRLPKFIESLNQKQGEVVCDHEKIHIKDPSAPDEAECLAILATHTGNTSVYSFAAEVEYHARFLTPLAKIKIPFFGRSIYESAIRADMTVGDTEFEGPAPFYKADSKIVKRQFALHSGETISKEGSK